MKYLSRRILLASLLLALSISQLYAFKFQPILMDFEPSGQGATRTFTVENPGEQPIAVQITMLSRDSAPDGTEINHPASDDFTVYPSQIILRPGATQNIRVRWNGTSHPEKELPYRIVAEQLPVRIHGQKQNGGQVSIMFRYVGSVYVLPPGTEPDVTVKALETGISSDGRRQLRVSLQNFGTAHSVIMDPKLYLNLRTENGREYSITLTGDTLDSINGENILAGRMRDFFLPAESFPGDISEITGRLSYEAVR